MQQVNFALQVYLYNLPVLCRPREMAGTAFMEEQVKHDPIKGGVLRMTVTVPVCNMHIQFYISLQQLVSVDAERCVDKVGPRLAVPESELDNLDDGTGYGPKTGPKRTRVPDSLPFELGPFFSKIGVRFAQERRDRGASLVVDGFVEATERYFASLHTETFYKHVMYFMQKSKRTAQTFQSSRKRPAPNRAVPADVRCAISITPQELHDLLDALEASRAPRRRAWENLQEIRWVL
jgi:hypothetical protein